MSARWWVYLIAFPFFVFGVFTLDGNLKVCAYVSMWACLISMKLEEMRK